MMVKNIVLLVMSLLVLSCVRPVTECGCVHDAGSSDRYIISVEVELPYVVSSRSTFTENDLNRITDLNVFIYHDGKLLEDYCGYFTDVSELMLAFPCDKNGFDIYMVANVGKVEAPLLESEISDMRYVVNDYDDFRKRGFPMSNVYRNHMKGTLAVFKLKRLIGQYDVVMRNSAADATYTIKDVRLLNCALDVYPFDAERKASVFTESGEYGEKPKGDALTEKDIEDLNAGKPVSLYFVENLQGELLPGNDDRRKKIPSSLEDRYAGVSDRCTYIEITADVSTPAAEYSDGKYRFYLGQNETTDFSIRRNTLYEVTLDFTQNMVCEEEWRIEVSEPLVRTLTMSKSEAHVIKGTGDYILLQGPQMKVSEEKSGETSDELGWMLEDVAVDGNVCQKLSFFTERDIVGMYNWGDDHKVLSSIRTVSLESVEKYNGKPLLERTVTVYVHDRVFPVFIRVGENGTDTPYQVEALTDAPVRFDFNLSASLKADAGNTGTVEDYQTSPCSSGCSKDGYGCCSAVFSSLVCGGESKIVYFSEMDVMLSGKENESCRAVSFYMGSGGETYWGPGAGRYPHKFGDLATDDDISFPTAHSCGVSGCVRYVVHGGKTPVFIMSPKGRTCNTVFTTGTNNSLSFDINCYNSGTYLPFYIINGGLIYSYPVTLVNEDAKYLDDSARKSIIYEMLGPGRDVFYPNGTRWGNSMEMSPGKIHRFGYTAGLTKQFFGNIHTWQIYQQYDCDFFMTVNGCTTWPGASNQKTGFLLP